MSYANRLTQGKARGEQKHRGFGTKLLGSLAGRYRAIRKRLSDMLARGDRDYATLSALSQEIGRMRQRSGKTWSDGGNRESAGTDASQPDPPPTFERSLVPQKGQEEHMHIEPRQRAKLARTVRYGGVALIAAWSLLAIVAYAAKSAVSGWLLQVPAADGWNAWSGHLLGQAAGLTIVVAGLTGTVAALALMAILRRLTA